MPEGRVAKNTAYLVTAFVGQKVLAFVYFTIIARSVGVTGSGRYFVALSFTTIFSIFVDLGLSNVLVREVAKFPENAEKLLANVLGLKAGLAAATILALLVTAQILGFPPETQVMIAIASGVMVLDSIHLVFYGVMRGFQNLRYEAIGVVTGQAVTIAIGIFFILMKLPLPFLIVALFCGSSWNVLWSGTMLRRRYHVTPRLELDRTLAKFYWSVTLPFALAGIFSRVYSYIDSIMLSRLVSETAVGYYSVAYKIVFAFQFLPMAFAAAIYPAMSEYYVSNRAKLGQVAVAALKYLMVLVVPLTTGIFVLAKPIIYLVYGPNFAGSVLPLQILIFSLIFAFLYWPCGSLLNACDRQAHNTAIMGLTMVSNVILNVILIPRFAAPGAATAALIGNGLLFGGAFILALRTTPIDLRALIMSAVKIGAASAIMGLAVNTMRTHISLFISIPAGIVIYAGALLALGGVTLPETKRIINVFLRRGRGVSDIVE